MFAYANVRLHEERDVITAKHTHPQLANWLLSTKLNSIPLPRHGRIITLRSTDTVSHAIKTLTEYNILSAPVLDASQNPPRVVGLIDFNDIVEFALKVVEDTTKYLGPETDIRTILEQSEVFYTTEIGSVVNFSKRDPLQILSEDTTLAEALNLLARHGFHRVLVTDRQNNFVNMITQSAVVRFLVDHTHLFKELLNKQVVEIKHAIDGVVSIHESKLAVDAFKLMRVQGVSAVAVVNDQGIIIGNISAKDLRLVSPEIVIPRLFVPCSVFIARARVEASAPLDVIHCTKTDTFGTVLDKFYESRLHRVWIVEGGRPVGVIALRDVLFYILVKAAERVQ